MKHTKIFSFIVISLLYSSSISAQSQHVSKEERNIYSALENLKIKDSLLIESQLSLEITRDYYEELMNLNPEVFGNKNKAKELIQYYSTPKGIEEIMKQWIKQTESNSNEILPIGTTLYMKIYFNSENLGAMIKPNLPNKYATLIIINEPEDLDADIYLNNNFVCTIIQAKNGIRVHSGQPYQFELRLADKVYCKSTITLSQQEKKITKCKNN